MIDAAITLSIIALITIGGFIAINLIIDYVKGKWNERNRRA